MAKVACCQKRVGTRPLLTRQENLLRNNRLSKSASLEYLRLVYPYIAYLPSLPSFLAICFIAFFASLSSLSRFKLLILLKTVLVYSLLFTAGEAMSELVAWLSNLVV